VEVKYWHSLEKPVVLPAGEAQASASVLISALVFRGGEGAI